MTGKRQRFVQIVATDESSSHVVPTNVISSISVRSFLNKYSVFRQPFLCSQCSIHVCLESPRP